MHPQVRSRRGSETRESINVLAGALRNSPSGVGRPWPLRRCLEVRPQNQHLDHLRVPIAIVSLGPPSDHRSHREKVGGVMICASCGTQNNMGDIFCQSCGQSLTGSFAGQSSAGAPKANRPSSFNSLETKSFLRSLFDWRFESFVAMKVIRIVYVIVIILSVLYTLAALLMGLASGVTLMSNGGASAFLGLLFILGTLILSPLVGILFLAFYRIFFELIVIIFSIGNDVKQMVVNQRTQQ